jgi:hypothetical protein
MALSGGKVVLAAISRGEFWGIDVFGKFRKQSEGRVTFIYRFDSEIPPVTPLRLKVEINTREQ